MNSQAITRILEDESAIDYDQFLSEPELEVFEKSYMSVDVEKLYEILSNVHQFADGITSYFLKDTTVRDRLIAEYPDPYGDNFNHDIIEAFLDNNPAEFFKYFERCDPGLFREIVNAKSVALYLIGVYNADAKFLETYDKIRNASEYSLDELAEMYGTQIAQAGLLRNYPHTRELFIPSRKVPLPGM